MFKKHTNFKKNHQNKVVLLDEPIRQMGGLPQKRPKLILE
jgi:hypothetical protein